MLGNAVARGLLRHVVGHQRHVKKPFFSSSVGRQFSAQRLEQQLAFGAVSMRGDQTVSHRALRVVAVAEGFKNLHASIFLLTP